MRRSYRFLIALIAVSTILAPPVRAQSAIYRDSTRSVDERVRDLLSRMTLEEKFWQLYMSPGDLDDPAHDYSHGAFGLQIGMPTTPLPAATNLARAHAERVQAIQRYFVEKTRLGIPILPFEEAVHGLVRDGATVFPAAIGLAATWDSSMMATVAAATAEEAKARGIRDVLSPVINIASDVRWGRVEETYGEDPFLTSVMGRAFVRAFETRGIITTPKHFIANVGDGGRDSYPIDIDQRLLEELYFPPFKSLIDDTHARSVMTAYNSVDGSPATQNRALLNGTLKHDWGFTGFVISDAAATGGATVLHMTEESTASATKDAYEAGLDVVFQSTWEQHRPYLTAFQRKLIADSVIDAAVARVLRAKFEVGLFEHPYGDPEAAARLYQSASQRQIARNAARESIVLLQNDRSVLPLAKTTKSIALIGVDATEARLGGYTAPNAQGVSILTGLREALGAAKVAFAPGPGRVTREYAIVPGENLSTMADGKRVDGLHGEYFDNNTLAGTPKVVRMDAHVDFGWTLNPPARGIPFNWYSVRWTGTLTAPRGQSLTKLGVEGNDGYRLYLDGKLLIDNWRKQSYGTRLADVSLAPGSAHDLRLEYFENTGNARVKLVWDAGVRHDWRAKIDSAVSIARRSEIAVVVAGVEEGEFRDRSSLALPGHQEELIERVAATGKPVIVVLVGGSAITMSRWIDSVAGVIDSWYPGEEGGRAVADVLFGDYNPAGRLPITFAMNEGQLPLTYNHKPTGRGDDYVDGTGMPLFPFGFGLSYSTFEYSSLRLSDSTITPTGTTTATVRVRNTSKRAGDEVVQLYVRDVVASVARPVMQLAGFTRIHLEPNEEREVSLPIGRAQLQMLDRDLRWVVESGAFRIMVGASSKDIRQVAELQVR
ncbi:MAG TPA: glycoside hydrolase family 3 N-terminal domain-containing protein [Gemmatimonadaceae bacterium]|jgi:beta-glucosidase